MGWYGCEPDRLLIGPERVYRFVTPVGGSYEITTSAGQVSVLVDGPTGCDPSECLAQGGPNVIFDSGPGQAVYVVIDASEPTDFALDVACPGGVEGETLCADGLDNDGDGDVDCLDSHCADSPSCNAALSCGADGLFLCGSPVSGTHDAVDDVRFYLCSGEELPMPYPETVHRFVASSPGLYRFWLSGDGGSAHELVLLPDEQGDGCKPASCDSFGSEVTWAMGAGESVYIVVEGPPDVPWTLEVDCPAAPQAGPCTSTATLACEQPLAVAAVESGPHRYECDTDDTQELLGPQAIVAFEAPADMEVSFTVTVQEGPPAKRQTVQGWTHLLLGGSGQSCDPQHCLDAGDQTTATLLAGETVYVVADGEIDDEVVSATFTATCGQALSGCTGVGQLACGESIELAPLDSRTSAWSCGAPGAQELLTGFTGPEAGVRFDAVESGWVTFSTTAGDVFVLHSDACDPDQCRDVDQAATVWAAAGDTWWAVVEVDDPGDTATLSVACQSEAELGTCTESVTLSCGQTVQVPAGAASAHDAYLCDGDLYGGYTGVEAVGAFQGDAPQTVRFELAQGATGFVVRDGGDATCHLDACEAAGSALQVAAYPGQTLWLVADTLPAGAESPPASLAVTVVCESPFDSCTPSVALECDQTKVVPVGASTIEAYLCGDAASPTLVSGFVGGDVGLTLTAPQDGSVAVSVDHGRLFLVDSTCSSEKCVASGSAHGLFLFEGTELTLIADSQDPSLTELAITVDCD